MSPKSQEETPMGFFTSLPRNVVSDLPYFFLLHYNFSLRITSCGQCQPAGPCVSDGPAASISSFSIIRNARKGIAVPDTGIYPREKYGAARFDPSDAGPSAKSASASSFSRLSLTPAIKGRGILVCTAAAMTAAVFQN
jgi:hypothetical protein